MLNYCTVTQRIGAITQDTPDDDDRLPDYQQVFGTVTFTPNMRSGDAYKITDEAGEVHTVPALKTVAQIMNGQIVHESEVGVPLFAAGDNSNPNTITYTVTYSGLKAGTQPISLRNITFKAIPGETIDLGLATPVAGTPGIGIVQGPPGEKGEKGDPGEKGEKGDVGPPGDLTEAEVNALVSSGAENVIYRGVIPKDSNLDDWHGSDKRGVWDINPFTSPIAGWPGGGTGTVYIETTSGGFAFQRVHLPGINPKQLIRHQRTSKQPVWHDWEVTLGEGSPGDLVKGVRSDVTKINIEVETIKTDVEGLRAGDGSAPSTQLGNPALEHIMRVSDMRRRLGKVSVGERGAVTIVFDHGTVNFKQWVYPLLKSRGLPATLALNASTIGTSDRELGDWTDIVEWSNNGVEIANHGFTHASASGYQAIYDQIAGGRVAIEDALGKTVDTYVQVGMGDDAFDGFGIGRSVDAYANTHAGNIILQSHGVVLGGITQVGATYPIDGHIPQGFNGSNWIDSGSESAMASAVNIVDRAISQKRRMVVRCHPQNMGEGKLTEAILSEFLDYLVEKQNEGVLKVLSTREWAIADK